MFFFISIFGESIDQLLFEPSPDGLGVHETPPLCLLLVVCHMII